MIKSITITVTLLLLVLQTFAASRPTTNSAFAYHNNDSLLRPALFQPGKRTFANQLKQKLVRKALRQYRKHTSEAQSTKDTLALISLICGVASVVVLLIPTMSVLALLLSPAAIVMGIVALSKNRNPKSRTQAIIGIITGAIPILLVVLLFFLVFALWGGGIE